MLVVIVLGSFKKLWVPGWLYKQLTEDCKSREDALTQDRDEWKMLALAGTSIAEKQISVLARTPRKRVK